MPARFYPGAADASAGGQHHLKQALCLIRGAYMHGAGTKAPAGKDRLAQPAEAYLAPDRAIAHDRYAPIVLMLQQYGIIVVQMAAPVQVHDHPPAPAPIVVQGMNDYRPVACDGFAARIAQAANQRLGRTVSLLGFQQPLKLGTASCARMPLRISPSSSSIRVKPRCVMCGPSVDAMNIQVACLGIALRSWR